MQVYFSTLAEQTATSIPNIITALFIFLASLYLARWLSNGVKRVLLSRDTASSVTHLLADILRWTVIVFGTITALQRFFNVTAFLTGLGILGFTIGFALQSITQNFVSGIILLIQQPFKIGDAICVLTYEGVVLQVSLRTTEMQTLDGRIVILPNAEVLSHPIVNYTRAHRRCVEFPMTVSNTGNLEKIRVAFVDAMKEVPGYVAAPAPVVNFNNLGVSNIELLASFWVDTSLTTSHLAKDAALLCVKKTFAARKLSTPLPIAKINE